MLFFIFIFFSSYVYVGWLTLTACIMYGFLCIFIFHLISISNTIYVFSHIYSFKREYIFQWTKTFAWIPFEEIKFWKRQMYTYTHIWLISHLNLQNFPQKHVANLSKCISYIINVSVFILFTSSTYTSSSPMYLPSILQYIFHLSLFHLYVEQSNSSSSNPHTIFFTSFR